MKKIMIGTIFVTLVFSCANNNDKSTDPDDGKCVETCEGIATAKLPTLLVVNEMQDTLLFFKNSYMDTSGAVNELSMHFIEGEEYVVNRVLGDSTYYGLSLESETLKDYLGSDNQLVVAINVEGYLAKKDTFNIRVVKEEFCCTVAYRSDDHIEIVLKEEPAKGEE